jgi:hypothetical protein
MKTEARVVARCGWALALLLAALSTASAQVNRDELHLSPRLMPAPELAPEQVVRIQLNALRHNDARNRGIEVAFRFASPDNKQSTGPLPRFISMILEGPYSLMLVYDNAAYHPVEVDQDRARQRVTLIGAGIAIDFEFYLSRQTQGACRGCWMTDAVVAGRPLGLQVQS